MESKNSSNILDKIISKGGLYTIAILFVISVIVFSVANLSSVFSTGFSTDVLLYPLMFMKRLIPNTLFMVVIVGGLVFYGIKHQKLWYLIPVSIILIGFFWLSINNSVYKGYVKTYMSAEEKK